MINETRSLASRSRPKKRRASSRVNGRGPTYGCDSADMLLRKLFPTFVEFYEKVAGRAPIGRDVERVGAAILAEVFLGLSQSCHLFLGVRVLPGVHDLHRYVAARHAASQISRQNAQQNPKLEVGKPVAQKEERCLRERLLNAGRNPLSFFGRFDQEFQIVVLR